MKITRIKLKSLRNTRDLSGIPGAANKKIKEKMLIRSGNLSHASPEDIDTLINVYGVKTIIDLRTDAEISEAPDPEIKGIEYERIPLLDSSFLGIARDGYSMNSWLNIFSDKKMQPEEIFSEMYQKLVFSERTRPLISRIFDILLNSDGAVLWHCSAGKDRVGVITALILSALGFERDDIIADYMATAQFSKRELLKLKILMPFKIHDKQVRRCIHILFGVKEAYLNAVFSKIDEQFGGTDNFLEEYYGLDSAKRERLRKKFLY